VVISLDFELRWGMHDRLGFDMDRYRANLEGAKQAVLDLLELFATHKIRATWACVGALGCADWHEYFRRAPRHPPQYEESKFLVKQEYADMDPKGDLHFAPEILDRIRLTPGQELGTHTFSHLFLRESGIHPRDLENDLSSVSSLWAERFDLVPQSLVFPRNQHAFLDVVRASKIKIWRGNPRLWYYECNNSHTNRLLPRSLRLKDSLNPFLRLSCPLEEDTTRAALFLRTDIPQALWILHKARIQRELDTLRAAEIFHLWWHPENLGVDTKKRLARVSEILDMIARRVIRTNLVSHGMQDLLP